MSHQGVAPITQFRQFIRALNPEILLPVKDTCQKTSESTPHCEASWTFRDLSYGLHHHPWGNSCRSCKLQLHIQQRFLWRSRVRNPLEPGPPGPRHQVIVSSEPLVLPPGSGGHSSLALISY